MPGQCMEEPEGGADADEDPVPVELLEPPVLPDPVEVDELLEPVELLVPLDPVELVAADAMPAAPRVVPATRAAVTSALRIVEDLKGIGIPFAEVLRELPGALPPSKTKLGPRWGPPRCTRNLRTPAPERHLGWWRRRSERAGADANRLMRAAHVVF